MLSVTVETKRGDETPYEPISPTPLPDSPVEETKVEAAAEVSSSSSSSVVQKQPLERSPSLQVCFYPYSKVCVFVCLMYLHSYPFD